MAPIDYPFGVAIIILGTLLRNVERFSTNLRLSLIFSTNKMNEQRERENIHTSPSLYLLSFYKIEMISEAYEHVFLSYFRDKLIYADGGTGNS